MNTPETLQLLTQFFGWCTIISIGIMLLQSVLIMLFRGIATKMQAKMFKLEEEAVSLVCYKYLGHFKIAVIMFNLVPYLALKVMTCAC